MCLINWAERQVSLISWAILSCAIQSRFSASPPWWRHLRKSQFTLFGPHIPSPGSPSSLCISSSHDEGLVWQRAVLNLSSCLHMYYFYSSILLLLFRNSSHCSSKKMTLTLDFALCGLKPSPTCFQSLCA